MVKHKSFSKTKTSVKRKVSAKRKVSVKRKVSAKRKVSVKTKYSIRGGNDTNTEDIEWMKDKSSKRVKVLSTDEARRVLNFLKRNNNNDDLFRKKEFGFIFDLFRWGGFLELDHYKKNWRKGRLAGKNKLETFDIIFDINNMYYESDGEVWGENYTLDTFLENMIRESVEHDNEEIIKILKTKEIIQKIVKRFLTYASDDWDLEKYQRYIKDRRYRKKWYKYFPELYKKYYVEW